MVERREAQPVAGLNRSMSMRPVGELADEIPTQLATRMTFKLADRGVTDDSRTGSPVRT